MGLSSEAKLLLIPCDVLFFMRFCVFILDLTGSTLTDKFHSFLSSPHIIFPEVLGIIRVLKVFTQAETF